MGGASRKHHYLLSSPSRWLKRCNSSPLHRLSSAVLLVLVAVRILSPSTNVASPPHDSTSLLYNRQYESASFLGNRQGNESESERKQWREVLSWNPRVFLFHNFLAKDECEHLITLGKPHMRKSLVVDRETGNGTESSYRTSLGTFLDRGQDAIVKGIEERIAELTFIPVENGENLQILHYGIGKKYAAHHDYFKLDKLEGQGQREATLIMYLSDVEEGGETVFPLVLPNFAAPYWNQLSRCAKHGLAVRPKIGDALLFWNTEPDLTPDPLSLHESCPVVKGSKWSATKWMHVKEYDP